MAKVLEKFQNKKVFALYLIGVLVLSMGVSFAYFSANSSVTGEGSVATNTTATIESKGITANGNIEFNNVDMYPGHTAIASIEVIGTGENEPLMYNVIFNGTNTFNTPLNYTVYKSESNIEVSYTCTNKNDYISSGKTYYEECVGNNIESLGSPISSGTITNGEGKTILKSDEIMLTAPEGEVVYYYIVIEYPNLDTNQNDDMGSSINGNITIEQGSEYQKPVISMIGSTVSGSNNWYTSASIITNITTQTGNYEAYYCTTTDNSCTPDTQANVRDNSFTTTLSSNTSPQKVCARIIDEYGLTTEGCSDEYSVDTVNPTVSIASTSATENSITVTVNGTDAHSGIYQYRFSSNGGSSYITVSSTSSSYTYTFTGLNGGTSYNIAVQSIDRSGRVSTAVTRSVETDKFGNTMAELIAEYNIGNRVGFVSTYTTTTTNTVFSTLDWTGNNSYYFAGNPTDNWVYFAGYYWRIVRINGDKTTRLIYNGLSTAKIGESTIVGYSAFNDEYNRNEYVGFKLALWQQHGQLANSRILNKLLEWYNGSELSNNEYSKYISTEAGFCGDRTTNNNWSSTAAINYAAYERLVTGKMPSLQCEESSDLYNTEVGLITADEVAFAGGVYGTSNDSYYLYNNIDFWTMTPYSLNSLGYAGVFSISGGHQLTNSTVSGSLGIRPVINLKADTLFTGTGTSTDPYVVVE